MFFNIKTLIMSVHISSVLGNTLKFYFPAKKKGGGHESPQYTFPVSVSATKGIVPCFCSICALSLLLNASYFLYNEAVLNVV